MSEQLTVHLLKLNTFFIANYSVKNEPCPTTNLFLILVNCKRCQWSMKSICLVMQENEGVQMITMNSLISWLAARVSWSSVNVSYVGCTKVCDINQLTCQSGKFRTMIIWMFFSLSIVCCLVSWSKNPWRNKADDPHVLCINFQALTFSGICLALYVLSVVCKTYDRQVGTSICCADTS